MMCLCVVGTKERLLVVGVFFGRVVLCSSGSSSSSSRLQ